MSREHEYKVRLSIFPPYWGKELRAEFQVAESISDPLAQLVDPVEFDFAGLADRRKQQHERDEIIRWLSREVTRALVQAIESRDTVNGYPNERALPTADDILADSLQAIAAEIRARCDPHDMTPPERAIWERARHAAPLERGK